MNEIYETLLLERIDVSELPKEQQGIVAKLIKKFKQKPNWNTFTNFYMKLCKPIFNELPRKRIPESPIYRIAQDLALRLGVQQGKARAPDYRDILEYLIRQEYSTVADFCREAGVNQATLSHLFAKRRNASMGKFTEILDKLGYQIQFGKKRDLQKI